MSVPGIMVYMGNEIYFEKYSMLTILFTVYNIKRVEITPINAVLLIVLNLFDSFTVSNFDYNASF